MNIGDLLANQVFAGVAGAAILSAVLIQLRALPGLTRDRPQSRRGRPGDVAPSERVTATGITTSGLLNAIDGVAARDGRVLVITSNHADQLDPALVRPGRVDMRCAFGLAGKDEAVAMFQRFCPEADEQAFADEIAAELPLSQAELQNRLLRIAA